MMPMCLTDCPVPTCTSQRLVKLSNHLLQVHNLSGIERKQWLMTARTSYSMHDKVAENVCKIIVNLEELKLLLNTVK